MTKIAVIGGGISGLASAFQCKLLNPKSHVTLLELQSRTGGWIQSKRYSDGSIHEMGPHTIRIAEKDPVIDLVNTLGINDHMISLPTIKNGYIYTNNKLVNMDYRYMFRNFIENSVSNVSRLFKSFQNEKEAVDFTADYYFRSRFGNGLTDNLFDPLYRGIYACDLNKLGIKSINSDLLELEKSNKNVYFGLFKKFMKSSIGNSEKSSSKSSIISFRGGLSTLTESLNLHLKSLNTNIITDVQVVSIKYKNGFINIESRDDSYNFDNVIVSTPSYVTSSLLGDIEILNKIKWTTVAVVVLEFDGQVNTKHGFGHLIPSKEIPHILGIIYDSHVLPELDSKLKNSRLTVMMGGSWFSPCLDAKNESQLTDIAFQAVQNQIGVTPPLLRSSASIHYKSIPVYGVGHKDIVEKARQDVASKFNNQVVICGYSYDGAGVGHCISSGISAANMIMGKIK